MYLATHACAGVVIQKGIGDWRKAVPLAFISHAILDGFWPRYHEATPAIVVFNAAMMPLIVRKWRDCWPSILAACCWDLEWLLAMILTGCVGNGCDQWSVLHRFVLWNTWRVTPWFGVFEMAMALLTLSLLWISDESPRKPFQRPSAGAK